MGEKRSGWLIGCGIGCGVLVLLAIAGGTGGVLFVRRTMGGFENAIEARQALDERYGEVAAFTPWPDGAAPPDRIEAFLKAREASDPERQMISQTFESIMMTQAEARELESKPFMEKMTSVFGIGKSAMGVAGRLGRFFQSRNEAMLAADIGMGEYTYLYALAYYSWLEHSPDDGPENLTVEMDSGSGASRHRRMGDAADPHLRDHLLSMLRNQLASLPVVDGEEDPWKLALAQEIEALEADPDRFPWQESVPGAIAAAFEPYRNRLESTYSPVTNAFELARNRKKNAFSVTVD